jgi:hypothetical protein
MPANGDGTYDGAGGSVLQPVASNAMTMRRMTRLNVRMFTALIVKWSSQLSDARLPRRFARNDAVDFRCNDRRIDISRNAVGGSLQRSSNLCAPKRHKCLDAAAFVAQGT